MARPEIFIPEGVARYVKLDRLRIAADASSGLRELLIPHARFEEVMQELTLHQLKWRPDAIDGESRCLLIFGRTRAGKSVPLRHFCRQYPAFRDEHGMVRRALYVPAPSGADRHSLQRRLLDALGLPINVRADEATMIIARHLRLQRIEILIIDEFNHLADLKSSEKQYLAGDMLKEFTNFNSCQLVFCGLESSLDVLSANKQLFHRSPKRFEIRRYDWTIKDDRTQFQEFLDELADAMPFRRRPGLDDDNVAARIASATGGLVGIAVELVALATEIAALAGSAVFRLDHLASAYDALKPPKLPSNPFRGAPTKARFDETFADIVSRGIEDRIDLARKKIAR